MNFIIDHASDILTIATTVISAASGIAALTPTPKDDQALIGLHRLINFLALNVGRAGRQKADDPKV